ncbi:uncharacterized protein PV09_07952 [Verruconis gallopava]|uniref:GTP-binding protein rhoC n=1 Tax=Verruconis gallopava TaxID=253628 RepID=A0A0D1YHT6_9PEZI|nr:uncharacterized protein PV09_07952 [Verruconis gallopava]KIW00422.1 hypothetical protein PV09_07952 [Verruconis gallopava]
MASIQPVVQSSNYDYLRRKDSSRVSNGSSIQRDNSFRQPHPVRQPNERVSNGTMSTTLTDMTAASNADTVNTATTEPPAYSKKIVVVGDGGCGKTCLLISYAEGRFPEKYVPTVFENYITHTTVPGTHKPIELALWDTAGQEEYDRLRPLSYPETDLLFVCFAIDCPNSLENVMDKWYPEVLHFLPNTPIILIGLKSDLRHNKTCIDLLRSQGLTPVTKAQGEAVAQKMGAKYMECSSKEWVGVEEIFDQAILDAVAAGEELEARMKGLYNAGGEEGRDNGLSKSNGKGKRKKGSKGCKIL